jgi:tetratricopeptide (TPR) repeat protein
VARAADGAMLWSRAFDGPASEGQTVRQRAAAQGAEVISCAVEAVRDRDSAMETETFSMLLRACSGLNSLDSAAESRALLTQVVAQEPDFAFAHALLAVASAEASARATEPAREQLRTEARREAERALGKNRRVGEGYVALEVLEPRRNWTAREDVLQQGLEHDELNGALNSRYAELLIQLGRSSDALTYARRSSALDPLSPAKRAGVGFAYVHDGDLQGARDVAEELARTWPDHADLWLLRMRIAFWSGNYDDAMALLDTPNSPVRSTRARQCWRQSVDTARSAAASPARRAGVERIVSCSRSEDLPIQHALVLLATLSELDDAFALARARFIDDQHGGHEALFTPHARAMRADARFMPLMRDLGLLRHWRLSGRWPDFCRDPGLPYRCDVEARRLL